MRIISESGGFFKSPPVFCGNFCRMSEYDAENTSKIYSNCMGVTDVTKEMKLIGGFAICAMLVLVGVTFAMATEPPAAESFAEAGSDTAEGTPAAELSGQPDGYVVRSDGISAAVYKLDGEMLMPLDILPSKLRSADAARLADGIYAADDEALWRLIEDLSS